MELWIPITLFAAFCQNARSALQKYLKGRLGTTGATFVRFGYGVPFAMLYVAVLHLGFDMPLPAPNPTFLIYAALGGLAQILATFLLVKLFSFRNFAVGTAYSKTEPLLAALFGYVLLGEQVGLIAGLAIGLGIVGVIVISTARQPITLSNLKAVAVSGPAIIGLMSAALFGASAASYRAASLSLDGTELLMQAAFSLACVTAFQTVVMATWMVMRAPAELRAAGASWRYAAWVGLAGVAGSIGWFTAMTLQQVAYVRALAQVELIFTLAVSWLVFKEQVTRVEVLGCALIALGVVGIVLAS